MWTVSPIAKATFGTKTNEIDVVAAVTGFDTTNDVFMNLVLTTAGDDDKGWGAMLSALANVTAAVRFTK